MVVFVDCRIIERKGATALKTKLIVNEEELLIKAVRNAVGKYANSTAAEDIDRVFNLIKSVTCDGSDLTDFLIYDTNCNLDAMNSTDTPIFKKGIDILLSPVEPVSSTTTKKTKLINPLAVIMKDVQLKLYYLKIDEEDMDVEPEVDEQIRANLYKLLEEIDVGYCSNDQKKQLVTNTLHIKNALCFVQKHWKVLLHAEYPHIPTDEYKSSELLNILTDLNRTKKKK